MEQEAPKKSYQEAYADACQKAGELQYRMQMHAQELKKLNKYIKKLNVDAHREMQRQAEVAAALAKKDADKVTLRAVDNEPEAAEDARLPHDVVPCEVASRAASACSAAEDRA